MYRLPMRVRKLIGTILLVSFIVIYCLLAMLIGAAHLPGKSVLVQTLYYVVAGLAWTIPAALLIRWMQRPDVET